MVEQGLVVETANGVAWVEKSRQSQCGGCRLRSGCGSAVLSKILGARRNRVQVIDPMSVNIGDTVLIELDAAALIRGSFAVYMIPLMGLLLGSIVGKYLFAPIFSGYAEGLTIVFAMIGLFSSIWWLRRFSQSIENDARYQPVISDIIEPNEPIVAEVCRS